MDANRLENITGRVALVSGANRGIGAAFVQELLAAGAARVYAGTRDPQALGSLAQADPRVVPVQLDVADEESVRALAARLTDVNLLVNNAGLMHNAHLIASPDLADAHHEMAVNYFGLLHMCRAFAPVLAANGGGTIINLLSILARVASPAVGSYSASKAAAFSLTQSVRAELRGQGTQVIGVLPGFVDTDMTSGLQVQKIQPRAVAHAALAAVGTDQEDVYPGEQAAQVAALLLQDPKAVEHRFAQPLAG